MASIDEEAEMTATAQVILIGLSELTTWRLFLVTWRSQGFAVDQKLQRDLKERANRVHKWLSAATALGLGEGDESQRKPVMDESSTLLKDLAAKRVRFWKEAERFAEEMGDHSGG